MADLPTVNKDCDYVWEQFKKHEGFEDAVKYRKKDASFDDMKLLLREVLAIIYENQSQNQRTLFFVYYGGHGMIKDGQLEVVTNQTEAKKRNY